MREQICNGIGPARGKTLGSRIAYTLSSPILAFAGAFGLLQPFKRAGDDHDLHYHQGGGARDKRLADGVFLAQLLDSVSHWGPLLRPIGWAVAVSYWLAVAIGGWGSFSWRAAPIPFGELRSCKDCEDA